uniref:Uncharacterized protein n=1 Tax=Rhodnius prolixus TaxID=13249 RepID=T1HGS2_RHOPR
MPIDKEAAGASSGALQSRPTRGNGDVDINSLIISKLDLLSNDIAACRKEQTSMLAEVKGLKTEFSKLISKLEKELKVCKKKISALITENTKLRERIMSLSRETAFCTQIPFQSSVKIDNLPVTENEDLFNIVKGISDVIGLELNANMVDYIYRRQFGRNNSPSIIIKFLHTSVKNKFIINSKKNKEKLFPGDSNRHIYVTELLSSFNYKLFQSARNLKKQGLLDSVWHRNGLVLIKKDVNDQPRVIICGEDLLFLNPATGNTTDDDDQEVYDTDTSSVSLGSKRKRKENKPIQPAIANFLVRKTK